MHAHKLQGEREVLLITAYVYMPVILLALTRQQRHDTLTLGHDEPLIFSHKRHNSFPTTHNGKAKVCDKFASHARENGSGVLGAVSTHIIDDNRVELRPQVVPIRHPGCHRPALLCLQPRTTETNKAVKRR